VSYSKLGDLMRALGQGEEARRLYALDLEIAERLAAAEPDRADYQRDLSVSQERVAILQQDPKEAATLLSRAASIRQGLLEREPERVDLAEELAVTVARLYGVTHEAELLTRILEVLSHFEVVGTTTSKGSSLLAWARDPERPNLE
jgi:hypothetical protein